MTRKDSIIKGGGGIEPVPGQLASHELLTNYNYIKFRWKSVWISPQIWLRFIWNCDESHSS